MTLIVGILCSDGVVVAADGAATFGVLGTHTIRQPTTKLEICHGSVIVGVSGHVGLGQKIIASVCEATSNTQLVKKKPVEAMTKLSGVIRPHIKEELDMAATAVRVLGNTALNSAMAFTLSALVVGDQPAIIHFDQQGAAEQATDKLPFISIGSGQPMADPFLALQRKIFFPRGLPSLADGIFAAMWTLLHAIDSHPGGVAEPIQVAVIDKDGSKWKARHLPDAELSGHRQMVAAMEEHLRAFPEKFRSEGLGSEVQEPPKPGGNPPSGIST